MNQPPVIQEITINLDPILLVLTVILLALVIKEIYYDDRN